MKAKNLDDVIVYQKSIEAAEAIIPILERPAVRRDFDVWDQLSRSSSRIPALIAEGFGQLSDRHFATYLGRARGSTLETQTHLRKALKKRYITKEEFLRLYGWYSEINWMLTDWAGYLQESDWKTRR